MDAVAASSVAMTDITIRTHRTILSAAPTQYAGSSIPDWCRADPLHGMPEWCRDDVRSLAAETMSMISSLQQRSLSSSRDVPDSGFKSRESKISLASEAAPSQEGSVSAGPISSQCATTGSSGVRYVPDTEEDDIDSDMPYLEGSEIDESSSRFQKQGIFGMIFPVFLTDPFILCHNDFIIAAQQKKEAEQESQVVSDERVATHLQQSETQKLRGFKQDHELAKRLDVSESEEY